MLGLQAALPTLAHAVLGTDRVSCKCLTEWEGVTVVVNVDGTIPWAEDPN